MRLNKLSIMSFTVGTLLFLLSGCTGLNFQTDNQEEMQAVSALPEETTPESVPYFAGDLKDILIPSELQWSRENSMYVKTDSFIGGILNFTGRVEVNSLSEFFISTMAKNNWRLTGTVKYEKVLLAFVKADKTCLINIFESKFSRKTEVYIYVTEDVTGRANRSSMGEELFRR